MAVQRGTFNREKSSAQNLDGPIRRHGSEERYDAKLACQLDRRFLRVPHRDGLDPRALGVLPRDPSGVCGLELFLDGGRLLRLPAKVVQSGE